MLCGVPTPIVPPINKVCAVSPPSSRYLIQVLLCRSLVKFWESLRQCRQCCVRFLFRIVYNDRRTLTWRMTIIRPPIRIRVNCDLNIYNQKFHCTVFIEIIYDSPSNFCYWSTSSTFSCWTMRGMSKEKRIIITPTPRIISLCIPSSISSASEAESSFFTISNV